MTLPVTHIVGNLTRDPEMRFTPQGVAVCKFGVACGTRKRTQSGDWEDGPTTFVDVTAWRRLAENIAESLHRGDQVVVIGEWEQHTWQDDQGNNRSKFEVTARDVGVGLAFRPAHPEARQHTSKPSDSAQGAQPPIDEPPF